MKTSFYTISLLPLLIGLIVISSCSEEEVPQRTPEQERAELDSMLTKLINKGFTVDTTDSGVFYIIKKPGKGPFPQEGDTCYIEYRIHLLHNDRLIERSKDYNAHGISTFILGGSGIPAMTPGWEDGIKRMNAGSEIDFYIPSRLAYGKDGTSDIPPYTTVIYVCKMHDLRPKPE